MPGESARSATVGHHFRTGICRSQKLLSFNLHCWSKAIWFVIWSRMELMKIYKCAYFFFVIRAWINCNCPVFLVCTWIYLLFLCINSSELLLFYDRKIKMVFNKLCMYTENTQTKKESHNKELHFLILLSKKQ